MSAFRFFRGSSFLSGRSSETTNKSQAPPNDASVALDRDILAAAQDTFKQELRILCDRVDRALREELRNFLDATQTGTSRTDALHSFRERVQGIVDGATLRPDEAITDVKLGLPAVGEAPGEHDEEEEVLNWVSRRNSHVALEDARENIQNKRPSMTGRTDMTERTSIVERHSANDTYTPLLPYTGADDQSAAQADQNEAEADYGKASLDLGKVPLWMMSHQVSEAPGSGRRHCALLSDVVHSAQFDFLCGCLILINAIIVGVQVDLTARNPTDEMPAFFHIAERIFCGVFSLEVVLRNLFECTPGFWWNIFDCAVVGCQLSEVLVDLCTSLSSNALSQKAGILRVVRIFRSIRIFRSLRVFHLLGGLRMLVVSIYDSLRSLAWTFVLLFLTIYVLAVFLTQVVTEWRIQYPEGPDNLLQKFYGSLDRSLVSLYKTVSDGIHWGEVSDPLIERSPWFTLVFVVHMGFMLFAVMNVVTGVFVELAIRKAGDDEKRIMLRQMRDLFQEAGDRTSGRITLEDFLQCIDAPGMQAYFTAIDIDPQDARQLFRLLDVDGQGQIETDDLVSGCLRLHGSAKAIELAAFMCEYRRWTRRWSAHAKKLERGLEAIRVDIIGLSRSRSHAVAS